MGTKVCLLQYYNAWKDGLKQPILHMAGSVCVCVFWCLGLVTRRLLWRNVISHYSEPSWIQPWKILAFDVARVAFFVYLKEKKRGEKMVESIGVLSIHACRSVSRSLSVMHKITKKQQQKKKRERSVFQRRQSHIPAVRRAIFPLCWCFPPWRRYPLLSFFLDTESALTFGKRWEPYRLKFTPRFRPDPCISHPSPVNCHNCWNFQIDARQPGGALYSPNGSWLLVYTCRQSKGISEIDVIDELISLMASLHFYGRCCCRTRQWDIRATTT